MSAILLQRCKAYTFGGVNALSSSDKERLRQQFRAPSDGEGGPVLGGRGSVSGTTLEDAGRVVVKHYRRGGLLARLIKKTYLRIGKPRCRLEFEQMRQARTLGIRTPEAVAFAYRGGLFYHGWLITKEIEGQQSLATLSRSSPERAAAAIKLLAEQVALLVEHKILHADFHPGNVLVDPHNQVFIIDFDKARRFKGSRRRLKERYLQRWQRAVHKHGLPDMLVEMLRS